MRLKANKRMWLSLAILLIVIGGVYGGARAYRVGQLAYDFEAQVRYMIENGGTIGSVPASATFSDLYLEAIFGHHPELLDQLRGVIRRGLAADPDVDLGEVAALIVTHRENEDGEVSDVVAHMVGTFPLGRLNPQFHRDGFFRHQIDENIWDAGNTLLRFAGRDMVMFADEGVAENQADVIDGILNGNIRPLVEKMDQPIFYTAVLPNPRRVVPPQLRHHVQAMLYRGAIAPHYGRSELVLLANSRRSANYTMNVINDLKRVAEIALKTKFDGAEREVEWGTYAGLWWAAEMAETSRSMTIAREENLVRLSTEYERVMVNAMLKSLERFGRDWRRKRLVQEEQRDPRDVDREMATQKPVHYWSEEHRWGPNWPIAPTPEERAADEAAQAVRRAERELNEARIDLDRARVTAERAETRAEQARAQVAIDEPTDRQVEMVEITRQVSEETRERIVTAEQRLVAAEEALAQAVIERDEAEAAQARATEARREQLTR